MNLKSFCSGVGIAGSLIAGAFGGWSMSLTTLCCFMVIDYLTGLICAAVFHASPKTETGALESNACFKGLIRKCMVLLFVFIAHRLDLELGANYLRDGVCIAFMTGEAISIIENAGLMGIQIPSVLVNAIDVLKKQTLPKEGESDGS